MPFKIKLVPPECGKNWSLQFFGVERGKLSKTSERAEIWYQCRHFGEFHGTSVFLQGDSDDWMMVEFWTANEDAILRVAESVAKHFNKSLEV